MVSGWGEILRFGVGVTGILTASPGWIIVKKIDFIERFGKNSRYTYMGSVLRSQLILKFLP